MIAEQLPERFTIRAKITKRIVDAARTHERDAFLWDAGVKGFGLKVTPAGNRVYILQYRINGRLRRYTIGKHDSPWTPDKARTKASELLGLVAKGIDPAECKEEERGDMTVAALCDLYVAEGCVTKKASTLVIDRSNIERHIKVLLGRKRVRTVTRADIERLQQDVAAGKTAVDVRTGPRGRARVRGGKTIAGRTIALLGAIFSFAVRRGIRPDNPVTGVALFKGQPKERFLSALELAKLGDALTFGEHESESRTAIAAIRLLIMTGCRKSEILGLRWAWVDFERGCLRLPDSKTGAKVVPIGAPALEVLAALPRIDGNPFALPGDKEGAHFVGLAKAWERLRTRAGLDGVRLHDLRHSFASVAVAGGDSLYLVGKVLGHRQSRTTEVYAHLAADPLRAVADRTAHAIAAAMKGMPGTGEIVKLPKLTA